MTHRHLTDEQLIATTGIGMVPPEAVTCDVCRERHQSLAQTLNEVSDTASRAADAAFPPEKLARQRARILARIERYGQRARILAFPSSHSHRPTRPRPRPFRRWVAAAAAAGLIVGLFAGRTVHEIPSLHVAPFTHLPAGTLAQVGTVPAAYPVPLRASSEAVGDDELLEEIELAVASAGPNALRPIEDVTPVAWEAQ